MFQVSHILTGSWIDSLGKVLMSAGFVTNVVSHVLNIDARGGFPNIDFLSLVIKTGTNFNVLYVCIMYLQIGFVTADYGVFECIMISILCKKIRKYNLIQ